MNTKKNNFNFYKRIISCLVLCGLMIGFVPQMNAIALTLEEVLASLRAINGITKNNVVVEIEGDGIINFVATGENATVTIESDFTWSEVIASGNLGHGITLIIEEGVVLTIPNGVSMNNTGTIINRGIITNNSYYFSNETDGVITNLGTFINNSEQLCNYGTFINGGEKSADFVNNGKIINGSTGTITNSGNSRILDKKEIVNYGVFSYDYGATQIASPTYEKIENNTKVKLECATVGATILYSTNKTIKTFSTLDEATAYSDSLGAIHWVAYHNTDENQNSISYTISPWVEYTSPIVIGDDITFIFAEAIKNYGSGDFGSDKLALPLKELGTPIVNVDKTTSNNIKLSWTTQNAEDFGGSLIYKIFYKEYGAEDSTNKIKFSETGSIELTNLKAETKYDIKIETHLMSWAYMADTTTHITPTTLPISTNNNNNNTPPPPFIPASPVTEPEQSQQQAETPATETTQPEQPKELTPAEKEAKFEQDVSNAQKDIENQISEIIKDVSNYNNNDSANGELSAVAVDKTLLFAEEEILKLSAVEIKDDSIIINKDTVSAISGHATIAKNALERMISNNKIDEARDINQGVRFISISTGNAQIKIETSAAQTDVDYIDVQLLSCSVKIPRETLKNTKAPFTINIEKTNEISNTTAAVYQNLADVKINKTTKEAEYRVTLSRSLSADQYFTASFEPVSGDPDYQGVIASDGTACGGKYNPVTKKLEVRINKSGTYTVKNNKKNFTDISNKSQEMQKAINILTSKGIIDSRTDKYNPDDNISRSELVALIMRMIAKNDENASGNFTDVKKSDWFYNVVYSAKKYGIVNGISDSLFAPNLKSQKAQIIALAARTLRSEMKYKNPNDTDKYLKRFSDKDLLPEWGIKDFALAAKEGLIVLRSDGKFEAEKEMTRGEAAIVLYRLFELIW